MLQKAHSLLFRSMRWCVPLSICKNVEWPETLLVRCLPAQSVSSFRTKSKALNPTVAFREVVKSCRSQVAPSHSTCASLGSETL
jgi:hypothetical protein